VALVSVNPANGEKLASFPELTSVEIERKPESTANTFQFWKRTSLYNRAKIMQRAAEKTRRI
jgi:succinate-semialdehyde dehydrogenase / glutarate-semialdehyde dehydrogenase